jgi:2-polyprenyl-6-hydroxyphenyl methylase/3-demethylubiquinone-9 3-methyltransferase
MTMQTTAPNADPAELAKFAALAQSWWDPKGPSKPLHDLNPLRLQYVERIAGLASAGDASTSRASIGSASAGRAPTGRAQKQVLDVGCGGGILSESMARTGAQVLGIDLAQAVLDVAELHALEGHIEVKYRAVAVEELALERPAAFDLVTCMEMLEHVPDPAAILAALATLVQPGGDVIVSTLNRNPRAFAVAIVGAEYLARVLPRGTHDYLKFIRPSELARWGRAAGLELMDLTGITYNPFTRAFRLSPDTSVNYLAHFRRASAGTVASGAAAPSATGPSAAPTGKAGSGTSAR